VKHNLNEAVCLVTGASRGLGAAVARRLAHRGAKVALLARDERSLREISDQITESGGQAMILPVDARDEARVFEAAMEVMHQWGEISILINAIGGKTEGPGDGPADVLQQMIDLNYYAPLNVARVVITHMRRLQHGHIVNVSSVLGLRGTPYRGAYSASKAALVAMTDAIRVELKRDNINVSLVCPGRLKYADQKGAERFAMTYERAAEIIVNIAANPRPRTILTTSAKVLNLLSAVAPRTVDRILNRARP
jgi:2-deoxy-D-gluconate 3-dehydrogenase